MKVEEILERLLTSSISVPIFRFALVVEEREKELEKRREESRKIQEKEVPAAFHHDVRDVKGNKDRKRDISRKLKKSYACVVKEGMSGTKENV